MSRILWPCAVLRSRLPGWATLRTPPHPSIPSPPSGSSALPRRSDGPRWCWKHWALAPEGKGAGLWEKSFLRVIWLCGGCWILSLSVWGQEASGFALRTGQGALCRALLLLPLPCQQAARPCAHPCPSWEPYCNSPPPLHWNGALQDPSGTTHPTVCTQPHGAHPFSWELTLTHPLNILR